MGVNLSGYNIVCETKEVMPIGDLQPYITILLPNYTQSHTITQKRGKHTTCTKEVSQP